MVRDAVIRCGVVIKEAIDVVEPETFGVGVGAQMGEALHVALTQMARSVSHLLCGGAELRFHQFREPLKEKTAIDQDGDAPRSHRTAPERKAPSFRHTLRMVERAYSQGADVGE